MLPALPAGVTDPLDHQHDDEAAGDCDHGLPLRGLQPLPNGLLRVLGQPFRAPPGRRAGGWRTPAPSRTSRCCAGCPRHCARPLGGSVRRLAAWRPPWPGRRRARHDGAEQRAAGLGTVPSWPVSRPGTRAPIHLSRCRRQQRHALRPAGRRVIVYSTATMTPGCTEQACDFRDSLDSLAAAGYAVLGVLPDRRPTGEVPERDASRSRCFPTRGRRPSRPTARTVRRR